MTASALTDAAALEHAFRAFNEHSSVLESSYRELEARVAAMTAELEATHSARHRELLEKERLSERLERLLEALPGAVVILDGDGIIRECNAEAAALLNQPLVGRPWADIVRREFTPDGDADGELTLADGRTLSLQRRALCADEGEILLLTDVTESRRMAELLARHRRLSAIGEMTARLAHQIRTPLASALLYASQLAPGSQAPDSAGGRIVSRLRELDRMVSDMLQFAAGGRQDDQAVDVRRLLADVAETCRGRCGETLTISVDVADGAPAAAGNRDALKGALANLVDNAAAASPAGGRIELGAVRDGERLCLTVTDHGCGIPERLRGQIFEPFFTTRPQGTGLGLAVVRSVAEAHGGEVLVHSGGDGTTIALSLPLPAAVSRPAARHAAREAADGASCHA